MWYSLSVNLLVIMREFFFLFIGTFSRNNHAGIDSKFLIFCCFTLHLQRLGVLVLFRDTGVETRESCYSIDIQR
jgi:hypothetical protein